MGTWKTTRLDTPDEHPRHAAVYAVWVWNWRASVDTARLIYIGSTCDLRKRLREHRNDWASPVCCMYRHAGRICDFYVRYSVCSLPHKLRQRERRLIRKLRPAFNQETDRGVLQNHRVWKLISELERVHG